MRNIQTEILINASIQTVWNVIMDFKSYSSWNPFIRKISGSTSPGGYLNVTLQTKNKKPMDFNPMVLVNTSPNEFRWIGKLGIKGVFDGEHYFILKENGANRVKFIHGENFKGILSGLLLRMIGEDTKQGFIAMNKALKIRVESEYSHQIKKI